MSRVHWLALSSLLAVLIGLSLWCWQAGAVPDARLSRVESPEEARVRAVRAQLRRALETPTELDFVDTPLCDGLRYLSDYHSVRIQLDERALTDEGVPFDTPVTLALSNVTLEAALHLLLSPLQLEYLIDDDTLRITTKAQERVLFERESYPVRDLLDAGFSRDELRAVLLASVRPLEWHESGVALQIETEDRLAVRHHPSAQRELARTLEKLRAAMAKRRPATPTDEHKRAPAETAAERMERELRAPTAIDFVDTPLRDGLSYLQDRHGIRIWADEQALTDEGWPIDTPVTLSVEGASLNAALNLLLTPMQLDYVIEDEVLKVTTMAESCGMFSAGFYSTRDLLAGGYDVRELQEILRPSLEVNDKDLVPGISNSPFPGGRLPRVIRESEKPSKEHPSLRLALGDLLVVRATPRGHRKLAAALEKLRAAMGQ